MTRLGPNRYGKAEVRVVRVTRGAGPSGADVISDRNVSMSLSGDFSAVHLRGDNANVLATDTQKNMVYVLAQRLGAAPPEAFALALAEHFVSTQPAITRARVAVEEYAWNEVADTGHSFARDGSSVRTATVVLDEQAGASVVAGVEKLVVLNTTDSEFWGFAKDEYTTLPETTERMLATEVRCWWRYRALDTDWADAYRRARSALLAAFADTYSYSLQQTLYAMGERILAEVGEACEVRLGLPNKHHFLVDLAPFGMPNDNEVYYAADRPYGLIEGTVLADDGPPEGLAWT